VWFTLLLHPTVASLGKPNFFAQHLIDVFFRIPLLASLRGYWFTLILFGLNLLFLIAWVFSTPLGLGSSDKLRGRWVAASKVLFIVTLTIAFLETQPFILWVINPPTDAAAASPN